MGRPGSGKTYTLTARVLRELDKRPELVVHANYGINDERVKRFGIEDLMDLPPGLVVIDEAHLWFESRASMKLPPSMIAKMSQTRKAQWSMLWSTQHESRVDKVLRNVTNWMWLCNAWFSWREHAVMFTATCFEPEFFRKPKKYASKRTRFFRPSVAAAYDTFESLDIAAHMRSDKDVYDKTRPKPAVVAINRSSRP